MEIKQSWIDKGYVDEIVPDSIDLKKEIRKMCKEKNAVILAHYYTDGEVQDIADFVGDSLALAQWSAKTDADIIVMCGVHFMGETNKILCPGKKVLVLDLNAGCSLAGTCSYGMGGAMCMGSSHWRKYSLSKQSIQKPKYLYILNAQPQYRSWQMSLAPLQVFSIMP